MKQRNDGFSLIELIVIIAIMVVLTLGVVMGLSSVFRMEDKKSVDTICSTLKYTQTSAMTKSFAYCSIEKEGDGYYITVVEGRGDKMRKERKKLCSSKSTVLYATSQSDTLQEIELPLMLTYRSSSGAFEPMVSQVDGETFTYTSYQDASGRNRDCYCTRIVVRRNNEDKGITLYPKTGKCEQE